MEIRRPMLSSSAARRSGRPTLRATRPGPRSCRVASRVRAGGRAGPDHSARKASLVTSWHPPAAEGTEKQDHVALLHFLETRIDCWTGTGTEVLHHPGVPTQVKDDVSGNCAILAKILGGRRNEDVQRGAALGQGSPDLQLSLALRMTGSPRDRRERAIGVSAALYRKRRQ